MAGSNVSSVVNYFSQVNEGFSTTTSGTTSSGGTTVALNSTTGLTNSSIFVGIIEPGATNQQVFTGTVDTSGSQITGVQWTRGSNVAHPGGSIIVDYITGTHHNMTTAGILKQHTQTGTHKSLTTDTLTASGPVTHSSTTILTGAVSGAGYDTKTLSNSYKFSVGVPGQNFTATGFTASKIIMPSLPLFDTGSNFDYTTNYRFTAPISGFYFFTAQLDWFVANGVEERIMLYKNGSFFRYGNQLSNNTGGNFDVMTIVSTLVHLTATDYIELWGAQSSGGSVSIAGGYFDGFLVSAT